MRLFLVRGFCLMHSNFDERRILIGCDSFQSLTGDMRGIRWPENIIRWMIDLYHTGGTATLNLLRGVGCIDQGSAGKLQWSAKNFNLYLPSLTTIKSYLKPEDLKFGLNIDSIKELSSTVKAAKLSELVCVSFDEVSVKEGAIVRGETIFGFVSGELSLDQAEEAKLNGTLANNILLVMATTLDGQQNRPIAFYPTRTASAEFLQGICDQVKQHMTDFGLHLVVISGDCLSSNMTTFKHYANVQGILCIPDYSHVFKNLRNHLIGDQRVTTTSGVLISTKVIWDQDEADRDYFGFLGDFELSPRDKQSVSPHMFVLVGCCRSYLSL